MSKQPNIFLGIPSTWVPGISKVVVIARPQIAFHPRYLVIPKSIAPCFRILDIKIGKNSQLTGEMPAEVFSGEVVVLEDKVVGATSELPLSMAMDDCRATDSVCITVQNRDASARNFTGCIAGPPLEVDLTGKICVGMHRPVWTDFVTKIKRDGLIERCHCEAVLADVRSFREHWQLGHFDEAVYDDGDPKNAPLVWPFYSNASSKTDR